MLRSTFAIVETKFSALTPVQETLFLTLYLRALDCRSADPILGDAVSERLAAAIDYDFTRQKVQRSLVLDLAVRTKHLDQMIRSFVAEHDNAVVVDLGCGFDPRADRCTPAAGVDWYDVDFPAVAELRRELLPELSHVVGGDLREPGWLADIPRDRPAMVVADGLMAFLPGPDFKAMVKAITTHFARGEFATNAYTPLVLRLSNLSPTFKALDMKSSGEGFTDPREPERWGADLELVEERLLTRAPEVAQYPQPLRWFTELCSHSTWISRQGNRVVRYRFGR